ncbi:hypothetical protein Tco_0736448 [Tanacetum coccineum]
MESLNSTSQERELHQLQQLQYKAKESCMESFRLLHSHLKVLSYNDLNRTLFVGGFERAFASLFDQDVQTFTGTMLLNLDQLENQLDKEEFQEIRSFNAFRVLMTQFQTFINSRLKFYYDEGLMICKYFLAYTQTEVRQFLDTLIQHMESVKKSIDERAQLKRHYDRRQWDRIWKKQDTSSSSGNYLTHVVDADIIPVNDKMPFAEVQLTAQHNVLANEQQHMEQSEPIYDTYMLEKIDSNTTLDSTNMCHMGGEIFQDAEQYQQKDASFQSNKPGKNQNAPKFCEFFEINDLKAQLQAKTTLIWNLKNQIKSVKEASNEAKVKNDIYTYKELYDSIKKTRVQNKDNSDSLISQINQKSVKNADLKAQIQEKVFANAALKNELRKLKGNSVDTKFVKASILWKPPLQPSRNHSVVRQPNAFKSERPRISKPRWVPTGKIFTDSTTKVNSEPSNGSNDDITNPYECDQTLNVSAETRGSRKSNVMNRNKWRLQTTLQAPLLKEKKSVRFSALYLQKKRNLLLYTSSLLNASCKKSMNLLKKGLLVWGEAKTTSKKRVSRGTTDC